MQIIVYLVYDYHGDTSNFILLEFGLLFEVLMEAELNPSSRHYQHKEGAVYHPYCIDEALQSLRMKFH